MSAILVVTNLPDSASAFNLARELVGRRLAACVNVLSPVIRSLHPYTLPEILALPIEAGWPGYLEWVEAETRPQPAPAP